MDVLLKKDVERLGSKDEIVSVKNGYGRNYLIPKGLEVLATTSIKKMHAETEKQRALKNEKVREEATATLAKLTKKTFNVPAKVGENGKIFGSVTNVQVADILAKEGFTPYVTSFAPFLSMRASEQIRMELGYMQFNVRVVALGSGLAMAFLGNSHFGLEPSFDHSLALASVIILFTL